MKRNVAGSNSPFSVWISFLTSEHVLSIPNLVFCPSMNSMNTMVDERALNGAFVPGLLHRVTNIVRCIRYSNGRLQYSVDYLNFEAKNRSGTGFRKASTHKFFALIQCKTLDWEKKPNQLTQNKNTRWRKRPILSFSENKRMLCNARLVATHLWLGKFPFSERGFLEKGFDLAAIKQITVCFNSQRIFNKVHWKQ